MGYHKTCWRICTNRLSHCEARAKFHSGQGNKRLAIFWLKRALYNADKAEYHRKLFK